MIRLRHPVHEAGKVNSFDATTQEWVEDADGVFRPLPEQGPFTPQQLEAKGLGLPVLMNQALQTAVADRVAALAQAAGLTDQLAAAQQERSQALTERNAALVERDAAIAARDAALAQLSDCQGSQLLAPQAMFTPAAEVANPLLNKLSFGLLGKK